MSRLDRKLYVCESRDMHPCMHVCGSVFDFSGSNSALQDAKPPIISKQIFDPKLFKLGD